MIVIEIESEKMSLSKEDIEILIMVEGNGVAQHEIRESSRVPTITYSGQSSYRAKNLS